MRLRTKLLIAAAVVLTPVLAFGLYWFQPWKLWTDTTVHDALPPVVSEQPQGTTPPGSSQPTPSTSARDVVLARGTFVTHEHDTSGTATIVKLANGQRVLAISNLNTSEGPDVHVWLTDRAVTKDNWHAYDDGKYVNLGDLKGNHGNQLYKIPDSADLTSLKSVSIWCDRFDVSFGAAQLEPAA